MPVFTYMGTDEIQRDDAHSIAVVEKVSSPDVSVRQSLLANRVLLPLLDHREHRPRATRLLPATGRGRVTACPRCVSGPQAMGPNTLANIIPCRGPWTVKDLCRHVLALAISPCCSVSATRSLKKPNSRCSIPLSQVLHAFGQGDGSTHVPRSTRDTAGRTACDKAESSRLERDIFLVATRHGEAVQYRGEVAGACGCSRRSWPYEELTSTRFSFRLCRISCRKHASSGISPPHKPPRSSPWIQGMSYCDRCHCRRC